jgi:hypothetical protein
LPLLLLRAMRLLVNFPSHTLVCDLISCFIYRVAELAALKTQLEVALERQSELEEENKVRVHVASCMAVRVCVLYAMWLCVCVCCMRCDASVGHTQSHRRCTYRCSSRSLKRNQMSAKAKCRLPSANWRRRWRTGSARTFKILRRSCRRVLSGAMHAVGS